MAGVSNLADYNAALRTRDALTAIVRAEIDRAGYHPRQATVTEINADNRTCKVKFNPNDDPVTAKLGAIVPTQVGQVVSVSGIIDNLVVTNVFGGAALMGEASSDIPAPTGLIILGLGPGFVANWDAVPYIEKYELQVADDSGFTTNVRSYVTVGRNFHVTGLSTGEDYYVRVRGVSSSGGLGTWSSSGSLTVPGFPPTVTPDGSAPSSSPTPVCKSGLGMVLVEWAAVPNNDLVTYEVHADLESGFTPTVDTKITETTGTFFSIRRLADDTPLPNTSPTFVRIIAKDADGSAPASAQGFATPDTLNSNDFGSVADSVISDGQVPANSPSEVTVSPGIGYFLVTWSPVTNPDQVTYEIHLSTNPTFLPTANTKVGETVGTFAFVRERPPGFGGGPLTYDTVYYIRVFARDKDGYAPTASDPVQSTTVRTGSDDINTGAVGSVQLADLSVVSAKIADLAVGEGKIQDASISTAKIINGAITNAKIGNASISNAKIADLAVDNAKIANGTITDAKIASLSADKITVGTLYGITITGNTLIGNNIHGGEIVGAVFRTAETGSRVEIGAGVSVGSIQFFSGNAGELDSGYIQAGYGTDPYGNASGHITFAGPKVNSSGFNVGPLLEMWQRASDGSRLNRIWGTLLVYRGRISGDDQPLSLGVGNYSERVSIAQTQTRFYYSNGVAEFRLQTDGNITVYHSDVAVWSADVGTISDARHKTNIELANPSLATQKVRNIPLVWYEYNKPQLMQGTRLGMLAQDIEKEFPQGVKKVGDDMLLEPSSLIMLAFGAVKDLDQRLSRLENGTKPK